MGHFSHPGPQYSLFINIPEHTAHLDAYFGSRAYWHFIPAHERLFLTIGPDVSPLPTPQKPPSFRKKKNRGTESDSGPDRSHLLPVCANGNHKKGTKTGGGNPAGISSRPRVRETFFQDRRSNPPAASQPIHPKPIRGTGCNPPQSVDGHPVSM